MSRIVAPLFEWVWSLEKLVKFPRRNLRKRATGLVGDDRNKLERPPHVAARIKPRDRRLLMLFARKLASR